MKHNLYAGHDAFYIWWAKHKTDVRVAIYVHVHHWANLTTQKEAIQKPDHIQRKRSDMHLIKTAWSWNLNIKSLRPTAEAEVEGQWKKNRFSYLSI